MTVQRRICWVIASLVAITAVPVLALAEKRTEESSIAEEVRKVGLFEAMDNGDVEVRDIDFKRIVVRVGIGFWK